VSGHRCPWKGPSIHLKTVEASAKSLWEVGRISPGCFRNPALGKISILGLRADPKDRTDRELNYRPPTVLSSRTIFVLVRIDSMKLVRFSASGSPTPT
jgi:hypothetical protein